MRTKSMYDYFSFSMYKYAPESFKLCFMGKQVKLSNEDITEMGNTLATKGKEELEKIVKRWVRNKSVLKAEQTTRKILGIRTDEGKNTYIFINNDFGYGIVNIFNQKEKLDLFKELKQAYNKNHFNIEVTKGIMDEYGKMGQGKQEEIQKPNLLNRIIFV